MNEFTKHKYTVCFFLIGVSILCFIIGTRG